MDTGPIGRRIAHWRERRGFTQSDFGRLMAQTKRWVQDLEGGKRQQDPRLSVLVRAAEVLRIPLEQLLSDHPPEPPAGTTAPAEALAIVDALYREGAAHGDWDPPALPDLRRRLAYCCEAFQACHYGALARDLPALISDTQKLAAQAQADRTCEANGLLSRVFQLATSYLHKYGSATAVQAAVVADRALAAAERSGDPVQIGAASRRVAKSLLYQDRPQAALDFAVSTARRLSGDLTERGMLGLSTLGMLYLNAAMAASAKERSTKQVATATGLVDEAGDVADQQGVDLNEDWTMFGPTNVQLHRVNMLLRFEDGWSALEAAGHVDFEAIAEMTKERRAGYHISMARAALLTRHKDQAAAELMEADRFAPEEVEGRPDAVNLVKDVVGASPSPSWQLRELAQRCGLRA